MTGNGLMAIAHRPSKVIPVLAAGFAGALVMRAVAQDTPRIEVGPNVQVSVERSTEAHYETWIAVDPTDSRRMLACSMISSDRLYRYSTAVYRSGDGGAHWTQTLNTDDKGQTADPICTFAPDGTALYVVLTVPRGGLREMFVYRSSDAGATWAPPSRMPLTDREFLTFDSTGGRYHGRGYINGTGLHQSISNDRIFGTDLTLYRSDDLFRTYAGPAVRQPFNPSAINPMGNSVVLSDGTLVTIFGEWKDRYRNDGGRLGVTGSPNAWLKIVRSRDGGESIDAGITIADWYMSLQNRPSYGIARLAVDASGGPFNDRLYAVWLDARTGRVEIRTSHSDDQGTTWSEPILIDEAGPQRAGVDGPDAMHPTLAVNSRGVLAVSWADRRGHPDNQGWDARLTASMDGGETFLPGVNVSSQPNLFGKREAWPIHVETTRDAFERGKPDVLNVYARVDHFFFSVGDTMAIAVDREDVFHPVWTDNRTGVSQVWTAPVRVSGEIWRHGDPAFASLKDVTGDVRVRIDGKSYDRGTDVTTIVMRLENIGREVLVPPLIVREIAVRSDIGVPKAQGADKYSAGQRAIWDFSPQLRNARLSPGETTEPRALAFRLADRLPLRFSPDHQWATFVDLDVKVLSGVAGSNGEPRGAPGPVIAR
jgi:hypothetical protein